MIPGTETMRFCWRTLPDGVLHEVIGYQASVTLLRELMSQKEKYTKIVMAPEMFEQLDEIETAQAS